MQRRALLYGLAAALAGCGGAGTPNPPPTADLAAPPPDLAAPPDLATPSAGPDHLALADLARPAAADLAQAPYPAGPYGANVGDTFPRLAWVGYVNTAGDAVSTTKPYGAYSAEDLFRSGRPYALVHISEFF